ncbi:MAG TPA: glutamate racemase, partial [Candidatus Cloacimonadota bacterium]|nr:glutamate racemase [Candidatus Cloacimonadota bacterium]
MKKPIGIFDSGVGGLTVFKAIRKAFPEEDLIYFGDTARVPYGPKSPNTIIEYSVQNARFLLQHGIKTLIVACNTSASVALPHLMQLTDIPIIGVIAPGSDEAVRSTRNKRIGVIGTEGTVRSAAYTSAIKALCPDAEVYSQACPLFVPIVEE